jgi:hypothetical protein
MNTKTHIPFRIDIWDDHGDSIERHVAGLDDFETAVAAYWTACRRWPKAKIALRQEARIIAKKLGGLGGGVCLQPLTFQPGVNPLMRYRDCFVTGARDLDHRRPSQSFARIREMDRYGPFVPT